MTRQQKIHFLDDLCAAIDAQAAQMDALHPILSPDPGCPWQTHRLELVVITSWSDISVTIEMVKLLC